MKYNITQSNKQNYVWFRTAKCGTRSILKFLEDNTDIDINGRDIQYDNRWQDYFKFTIVRNPWDRLVSCWKNKIVTQKPSKRQFRSSLRWELNYQKATFNEFISKITEKNNITRDIHWTLCHNLFPVNDIDFIGRFENLQEDFNTVCDKIGIPQQELPHANKTKHKHYTEYYNDETKQIVAEKYAKDIELFGYEFGE